MEADQKISDIAAGMAWMAPQRPYFCEINQSVRAVTLNQIVTDLGEGVDHSDVLSISHGFRKKCSA